MQGKPDGFETVRKMENDLEKSEQVIRFSCYTLKNFQVPMLPCYQGFYTSVIKVK